MDAQSGLEAASSEKHLNRQYGSIKKDIELHIQMRISMRERNY